MIGKDDLISSLEKMSRERFHRLCLELLENMGFKIFSVRSIGGDFEAEAELEKKDERSVDYVVRITRSGGRPEKEIGALQKVLGPDVRGLYITTSIMDEELKENEYIEIAGPEEMYELMEKYGVLVEFDEYKEDERALPSASELNRLIEWGDEFRNKHNYHKAIEYYDKAITLKPESLKPRVKKGEVLLEYGEPQKASEVILTILKTGKESSDAWTTLGKIFHALDKYEDEIEAYERALDINEDNTEAWNLKGAALYEGGLYDEAELCFDRVLEVEPKDHRAWNNKGLCLMKKGDLHNAQNAINNALTIKPDHMDSLINKALVLEKQNKIQKALQVIDVLITLRPEEAKFHYIKGAYLKACNDIDEAYRSVKKALRLEPGFSKAVDLKIQLEDHFEKMRMEYGKDKSGPRTGIGRDELEEDKEYLIRKISEIERDIEDLKALKGRFEEGAGAERGISTTETESKDKEIRVLKDEKKKLIDDLKRRKNELDELKGMKEDLEVELKDLKGEEPETKDYSEKIEERERDLDLLREEKTRLIGKLNESASDITQLKEKIDALEKGASLGTEEETKKIISEIEEKEEQINELLKDKDSLYGELEGQEAVVEKLRSERDRLRQEVDKHRQEREAEELQRRETHVRLKKMREQEAKENIRMISRVTALLLKMGDHEKVLDIASNIGGDRLQNIRGCALYEKGDMGNAGNCFKKSAHPLSKLNHENVFFASKQYHKSSEVLEEREDEYKHLSVYWERRGESSRRLKNYGKALKAYEHAEEMTGDRMVDFILAKIRCRAEIEGVESGIDDLKKLVKIQKVESVLNLLGAYWYMERDYDSAEKLFEKRENSAVKFNNLGCTWYQLEKYDDAISNLGMAAELEEDNTIYLNNLGFCQLTLDLVGEAMDNFSKAVTQDKNDPVGWYNMGVAMKRLGEKGWKEKMDRSLRLAPNFKEAERMLKQ